MDYLPCAGVIVFDHKLEQCILVKTENNNYGFPKGKRNKGEITEQTALRELQEETGLIKDQIKLVDDYTLDELSKNGNPCIRYLLAICDDINHKFKFDEKELSDVKWYKINDAFKLLPDKRINVLEKAVEKIQSSS